MMQKSLTFQDKGCGEVRLTNETVGTTEAAELMARHIASLPQSQQVFFKECRVVAAIPFYMPRGDFTADTHATNMDDDQLAWLLKQHPEFKACDDTGNNHLSTGRKIIVSGA